MLAPVFAFVIVFAIIVGSYWTLVLRHEGKEGRVLKTRLKIRRPVDLAPTIVKARETLGSFDFLEGVITRGWRGVAPLTQLIEASGLGYSPANVLLVAVVAGGVFGALAYAATNSGPAAGVVGALALSSPFIYVRRAMRKRLATFEEQFPEAIELIARGLRAGHALTTTLQMVGEEIPDPMGAEFRQLFEQQNYGMSLTDALRAFAQRVPIIDARFFVTALLTQREMGGNLSEVLDNLAAVIRERFRVRRQVSVVSAHGRITGTVLGFMPPAVGLLLFFISPSQMRLLFQDPLGIQMVIAGVALQIIGLVIIRRIVNVEY